MIPASGALTINISRAAGVTPGLKASILALCKRAYDEDLAALFGTFKEATHVLGFQDDTLVSHAMWVTRWLQIGDGPFLRTAYVEMVATEPNRQRQGHATAILRALADAISAYDLGALCPAETSLYARLGWVFWRGPLFIRTDAGLIATPDENIMVLPLPNSPALELDQSISAEWRDGELW